MNRLTSLAVAVAACIMLAGCGTTGGIKIPAGLPGAGFTIPVPIGATAPITGATISRKAVIIGAVSFDTAEQAASIYVGLPRCPKAVACRDKKITAQVIKYVRQGISLRQQIVQFAVDHPGQLGDQGLQDSLNAVAANIMSLIQ